MDAIALKRAVRGGQVVVGFQQFMPSPSLSELAGVAGFDFVLICTEHGTIGYGSELLHAIRAVQVGGAVPFVRVTDNDPVLIHRAVEFGAKGIVVPRIKSAEEVVRVVERIKFPPSGERGICPVSRAFNHRPGNPMTFLQDANAETFVVPLIEHKDAVERIDEILAVPGIDFIWFGSGDLSASLGLRERLLAGDSDARAIVETYRQRVLTAARTAGIPVAQSPYRASEAHRLRQDGINIFITLPDSWWFGDLFEAYVADVRRQNAGDSSEALTYGALKRS